MARKPDPFWKYAEDMKDGLQSKKCNYCGQIYSRGTSVLRVKYHLSGIPGGGIRSCPNVPDAVKEEARAVIFDGPLRKKLKAAATSSNNQADIIIIPASSSGENKEAVDYEWMLTNIGEFELPGEGTSPGDHVVDAPETAQREEMQMHSQLPTTQFPLMNDKEDNGMAEEGLQTSGFFEGFAIDEAEQPMHLGEMDSQVPAILQPADLVRQVVEKDCCQIRSSSVNDDVLMINEGNTAREPERLRPRDLECQVVERDCRQIYSSSVTDDVLINYETGVRGGLQLIAAQTGGDAFSTPKLLGGAFEENNKVILSWLRKNEVSLIGIYGMGGAGKTTLAQHIYNQLLNMPDKFHQAYWINVSQDFSVYKLQNLIAKRIGLDLSNEDEEIDRADKLSKELAGRQNYVIILDDLWNHFDAEKVGIPSKLNVGCKLILTTRSLNVCRQMCCEGNMIKVEPLMKEEAWNLFTMELGNYDIKLEHLAKSVADECDGLPLGIRTMARSMRGVHDEREWRNALEELKEARVRLRDMEPEVFRILRHSFLHLNDSKLQQCFLNCALFPEDYQIQREELIEFFISERMIEGRKSREAEFDKGHEMLNQLVNACLLEIATTDDGVSTVKMHDLVRDMALQEMREKSDVIVEAGGQLEELPDEEKWTQNLVRVSLMGNAIEEIPSSHSPRCPNLSTLLLSGNTRLKFIADSFFKQMQRLEVLDLSHTAIKELPDSISDLVTLTALLLGKCSRLTRVPPLGKLKALKKLDLCYTALREMPRGLESLSNLKYLDLNGSPIWKFPAWILPKLCHLQVLRLRVSPFPERPLNVEELVCLRKLETLDCQFVDLLAFKKYLKELDKKQTQQPSRFHFTIGQCDNRGLLPTYAVGLDRVIYLRGQEINKIREDAWVLPKGIEGLVMDQVSDMKSLCDFYPSQHETALNCLQILNSPSVVCLVSFSQMSKGMLGTIEVLGLVGLEGLRSLYSKEAAPTPLLPVNGIFSHLKKLDVTLCSKLETLFPPGLLPNLRNLEVIHVIVCPNLEKIISEGESTISSDLAIEFSLPKLRSLNLEHLPALTSFGCRKLVCNSLQEILIWSCERLERLPFSCSPGTVIDIKVGPKVWWESVECGLKNDYRVEFFP